MDLVTLEDRFGPAHAGGLASFAWGSQKSTSAPVPRVTSRAPENTNPTSIGGEVPHFAWLLNDDMCYDTIGNDRTRYKGCSFGLVRPETTRTSSIGMYRTRHNQPIVVVTENFSGDHPNPYYSVLAQTGAFGRDPIVLTVPRGQGGGYHENHLMPWLRTRTLAELERIEAQGPSNRLIVVKITGSPTTWRRVAELAQQWVDLALNLALDLAAPYASSILGVKPADVLGLKPLLMNLAKGEPASIDMLAQAATLVAPASVKSELDKATAFYQSFQNGNYAGAAKTLGISLSGVDDIINRFAGNVPAQAARAAQNVYVMDVINQVRGRMRSGSAKQEIIDNGTLTQSPVMQNLLLTAVGSITSAVPRIQEIAGLAAQETNDLQTPAEWRSFMQMSHGYPVTDGSLDRLALRGLVERAREIKRMGQSHMNMPDLVPSSKRAEWADHIQAQTGVRASNSGGLGVSPLLIAAGLAVGAFFILKK